MSPRTCAVVWTHEIPHRDPLTEGHDMTRRIGGRCALLALSLSLAATMTTASAALDGAVAVTGQMDYASGSGIPASGCVAESFTINATAYGHVVLGGSTYDGGMTVTAQGSTTP